jgi:hypothetical protein
MFVECKCCQLSTVDEHGSFRWLSLAMPYTHGTVAVIKQALPQSNSVGLDPLYCLPIRIFWKKK